MHFVKQWRYFLNFINQHGEHRVRGDLQTSLQRHSFRYGKLFETWIIQEIIRLNDYQESGYKLYYWRTNTNLEVDLILSKGAEHRPLAIEIKSDSAPQLSDLHGLQSFASENPSAKLYCFCQTPRAYKLDKIQVVPWKEGLQSIFK